MVSCLKVLLQNKWRKRTRNQLAEVAEKNKEEPASQGGVLLHYGHALPFINFSFRSITGYFCPSRFLLYQFCIMSRCVVP